MADFEDRFTNLFEVLINKLKEKEISNDETIWNEIFSLAIHIDLEQDTEFIFNFGKDLIKMINGNDDLAFRNKICLIYLNLLRECAQLQPILKFVLERILRNSRGYLKDETIYTNFTNRLLNLVSSEFWMQYDKWCYCNLDIAWQFFILLTSFFHDTASSKNSNSNSIPCFDIGVTAEEENFWLSLVESKNLDRHLEYFFNFLNKCFDYYHQSVSSIVCFCLCHKDIWRSKFIFNNEHDDELDFEKDLRKLEKLVWQNFKKNSKLNDEVMPETGFSNPVNRQILVSQLEFIENEGKQFDELVTSQENNSDTSEWSIKTSVGSFSAKIEQQSKENNKANSNVTFKQRSSERNSVKHNSKLMSNEGQTNFIDIIPASKNSHILETGLEPGTLIKKFSNDEDIDKDLSDDGKTESAIESIPFDDPEYENKPVQNFLFDIPLLKFDQDEDIDQNDHHKLINHHIDHNLKDNDNKTFNQINIGSINGRENVDNAKLVDRALSPLEFHQISRFVQTDNESKDKESRDSSTTEIEGVFVPQANIDLKITNDQSTQTKATGTNEYISKPTEDHYLHVETMDSTEIQNIFKLAQTFSTIC